MKSINANDYDISCNTLIILVLLQMGHAKRPFKTTLFKFQGNRIFSGAAIFSDFYSNK